MEKSWYDEVILEGERVREKGDPQAAIAIFILAKQKSLDPSRMSTAIRHIGLCYEHLGNLMEAEEQYRNALSYVEDSIFLDDIARAKRHLLSIELKRKRYEAALKYGMEARDHMLAMPAAPTDIVWVTHGIVKVLIAGGYPKEKVREWVLLEYSDLKYMLAREENSIRRRVWTTGFLMDAGSAWAPWSWPLLPVAFLISLFSGLKLRQRQMLTGKR